MKKRLSPVVPLLALVTAAWASVPVAGQSGQLWLESRAGWVIPRHDLGRTDILLANGFGVFQRLEPSVVLGFGAGVTLGGRLALRASLDRVFDAAVQGDWRCAPFVACPAVLLPLQGEMSRWTGAVDVLYRPVTGFPFNPLVFAGGGLRRTALVWGPPAADIELPAFSFEEVSPFLRFGVGVGRTVRQAEVFGEFTVSSGRFGGRQFDGIEGGVPEDRRASLDMGLLGGVRLRLR